MSKRLQQLAINDEGFVFDPTTGESFTVNQTGIFIMNLLKENSSPQEITEGLTESYDVAPEEAERDVNDFINYLKSLKLS